MFKKFLYKIKLWLSRETKKEKEYGEIGGKIYFMAIQKNHLDDEELRKNKKN